MENRQFEAMLAVAQERLAQHIPEDIAGKAGAQYADGSFSLKTLGQTVTVRLSDCTIQPPLSKWHALTLLHLLDLADGSLTELIDPEPDLPNNRLNDGKVDKRGRFVVGSMDTTDPIVGVSFGLVLLGEGVNISAPEGAVMVAAAILAVAGVVTLLRFHPNATNSHPARGAAAEEPSEEPAAPVDGDDAPKGGAVSAAEQVSP